MVRERGAQDYDVAKLVHLRQLRTAVWVPRKASIADEPLRPGVAHEERRHDQVQLVRKAGREELGEDLPAPLDHQPPDAAGAQVLADPTHSPARRRGPWRPPRAGTEPPPRRRWDSRPASRCHR